MEEVGIADDIAGTGGADENEGHIFHDECSVDQFCLVSCIE